MEYIHPDLNTVVPVKLRIEIYKKAISAIEKRKNIAKLKKTYGLCLLLPALLWNLSDFLDNTPNGDSWDWFDAKTAFPELTVFLRELREFREIDSDKLNELRVNFLKKAVADLESTLN